jgi:RNA polymerase sigma-70 factor, ECF subfamily
MTNDAAARLTGISTSGMKSRVQRGRKRLAALLQQCCSVERSPSGSVTDYSPRRGSCACGPDQGGDEGCSLPPT